jgi:transcriptional regulator with XRE-family HTH domain
VNFNIISEGFGGRFKQLLKRKGITQAKFGDDTGTHKGLISRYINGESPSGDFIIKAVSYFPDDIEFLFFGNSESLAREPEANYSKTPLELIDELEHKLKDLKSLLTQ